MIENKYPRAVVSALRQALPYLALYRGRTFVTKIGGEIFDDAAALKRLFEQVGVLHHLGVRCVVIHGGGPQTSRLAEQLGVPTRLVAGRRVTDAETLACSLRVLAGELNARAVAICRGLGVPAVGLSGVSGDLVVATKRPPREIDGEWVDYGEVGDLVSIDRHLIDVQLDAGCVPIIAPISADEDGRILNCNADGVAAAVAVTLQADKLLLVTGAPG
ncbi:MAG: acetylglutamate kinase, partial [Planctomycetes bacterium]|nr:acetylglutamate kinase [Planctomycetota bacterium]